MPRHKTEHLYNDSVEMITHPKGTFLLPEEEIEALETHEAVQSAKITMLTDKVHQLTELLAWVGQHIHVRNANGQRTTAKCALCPFTYHKDGRGRMVKEGCRHGEIWGIAG